VFVHKAKSTITEEGLAQIRELPPLAVMVVCIGSAIGKVGVSMKRSASNQQINSIVTKEDNNPLYLYYLLKQHAYSIKALAGTQAVPLINKSEFSRVSVQRAPQE
jgi:type I restriction enzyme S subunit